MKTKTIIILVALACSFLSVKSQSREDSLAVERTCRNYIEGWKEADMAKIEAAVTPELVKRTVMKDPQGVSFTDDMSYSLFRVFSKRSADGIRMKDLTPDNDFSVEVVIFDISGDFASAKTMVPKYGFFDYCQLAKFNGEWRIFNILWGMMPVQNL
jgi:hypothetical protein